MTFISKASWIDPTVKLGEPVRTWGSVTIKKGSSVGRFSFLNSGTMVFPDTQIGKFCSIGRKCEIGAFSHPVDWISSSPVFYNCKHHFPGYEDRITQEAFERPSKTIIGHDVWIGSLSIILKGVKIGNGAIVAGGSVVTKDVEPYTIVGGVPAKVIRKRFSDEQIANLKKSKWWHRPLEEINAESWSDIDKVIEGLLPEEERLNMESGSESKTKRSLRSRLGAAWRSFIK